MKQNGSLVRADSIFVINDSELLNGVDVSDRAKCVTLHPKCTAEPSVFVGRSVMMLVLCSQTSR